MKLTTAVKNNITALSGHLLSNELISSDNDTDLRNTQLSEVDRAAKLVELVRCKVQLSPDNFYKFIKILEEEKQTYEHIIVNLNETLVSLKEGITYYTCTWYYSSSLAGQTLIPLSMRGERVWKLWPEFCDCFINLHSTYKIINN